MNNEMLKYLESCQEELKQLIRDLCAIPAPSHHEEKRAAFCKAWFEANGGVGTYIDEAQNVICPWGITKENPVTVFMAHTDTVFPDREPMPFQEDNETFRCPAVCDDTANLAVMMICARYFIRNNIPGKTGILFVANSCEEGLGNLKGSRALAKVYGDQITAWISFDGMSLARIVNRAVGSHRYQVTVRTEGGHSFNAFGNRNAIAVLSSIITTIYTVKVPQEGDSRTTYNVGKISGGTSVNTIAQEAQMLFEYRSDNRTCLEKMQNLFKKVIDAYRATGVEINVELVGDRPCAGNMDTQAQQALEAMAEKSVMNTISQACVYVSASTDCNIPLSLDIPSVSLSLVEGKGGHTREEILFLRSLVPGSHLCMEFLSHYFG